MSALDDIAAERRRQIEVEGWSPAHDDAHHSGDLSKAASLYAWAAIRPDNDRRYRGPGFAPPSWPWSAQWWKPGSPRRMLVKAAALIVAEIERLDRIGGVA
ncbi:hypothetical protein [Phenylobacterium sp.]|uniref:hypothetical protein n=1 Tax=Phenylobacterium sp. TaxID=1871053 RepID=UPI0027351E6E|nr:hypothetical protein [Phenylobacterium sp.]MDP3853638.1 hypothetical protein [Phenylobacterium sp.]